MTGFVRLNYGNGCHSRGWRVRAEAHPGQRAQRAVELRRRCLRPPGPASGASSASMRL